MPKDTSITSLGLDLSLTGTGFVIVRDGKIVSSKLIKSKKTGDLPMDELTRLIQIVRDIQTSLKATFIDIAVIENLAFGVRNATALTQLAGLNYFVRKMLTYECGYQIPFVLVAPTSLKKFITGNGGSKKDVMLMEVYKRYGETLLDDNICDSFALAKVGECLLKEKEKLPEFQREVLSLLKKQI